MWIARLRTSNKDNYASIAGRSRRRLRPSSALDGRPPPKARPGSDPGDLIRKMLSWTTKWPVAMKTDGKMLTDGVEASCSLCFEVMVVVAFGGMSGFVPSISLERKLISGPQVLVHPFDLMKLLKSDPLWLEWLKSWVTPRYYQLLISPQFCLQMAETGMRNPESCRKANAYSRTLHNAVGAFTSAPCLIWYWKRYNESLYIYVDQNMNRSDSI